MAAHPIRLRLALLWAVVCAYIFRVLIALDQLGNTIAGGNPDETISSRAGKARAAGRVWGCILCGLLDRLDKDHCARSIEADEL